MIIRTLFSLVGAIFVLAILPSASFAQVVPGTGQLIFSDDFEDSNWGYEFRNPKSSEEQDHNDRRPGGYSLNGKWAESALRGHPDTIKRIKTPDFGIEGSKASLLMRSLNTGIPGTRSFSQQQDDLLMNVSNQIGGYVPVSWNPSAVVRVYLPEWEYWENRSGAHFGFRADLIGSKYDPNKEEFSMGWFGRKKGSAGRGGMVRENYWPGFFVCYQRKEDSNTGKPYAFLLVRSGERGQEVSGPRIDTPGWWTLGMSFTGDGRVHYYARPGVEDLRPTDLITSQSPYGYRAENFYTIFFNVVNKDDGRNWTTPWVIDDPKIFWQKGGATPRTASTMTNGNR